MPSTPLRGRRPEADPRGDCFAMALRRRKLGPMRMFPAATLLLALLPAVVAAHGETTRIEIASGKRPFVSLEGSATAGQFTIWSGPGTSVRLAGGAPSMTTSERDFADWAGGPVEPPTQLTVFKVRFFCAAAQEPPPKV